MSTSSKLEDTAHACMMSRSFWKLQYSVGRYYLLNVCSSVAVILFFMQNAETLWMHAGSQGSSTKGVVLISLAATATALLAATALFAGLLYRRRAKQHALSIYSEYTVHTNDLNSDHPLITNASASGTGTGSGSGGGSNRTTPTHTPLEWLKGVLQDVSPQQNLSPH